MPISPYFAAVVLAVFLVGCGDKGDETEEAERIRAIKSYTVSQPAGGQLRTFSGNLNAAATSALSFSVRGTVASVSVAAGDAVSEGDILAELDTEPFLLEVQAARSELASAQANFDERAADLERQQTLFEKGWVASAALDAATAAYNSAEGQLNLARSKLGTAERNLRETRLLAPFDGLIASQNVEQFQEVQGGEAIFQINADGALEVDISIPDVIVGRIAPGAPVRIDVNANAKCGCEGRISEIGVASGAANAVTVTAVLADPADGLLPGMAAEVGVILSGGEDSPGYLVPITAIAPGDEPSTGFVFVYDPESSTVRKTAVTNNTRRGGGVVENLIPIGEGVSAGDIVASAGVSFLRDGQTVKLLGE